MIINVILVYNFDRFMWKILDSCWNCCVNNHSISEYFKSLNVSTKIRILSMALYICMGSSREMGVDVITTLNTNYAYTQHVA